MATIISHSPGQTRALGFDWGRQANEGWVVGLAGDLGAGKTELVRGIAEGLGFKGRVHSPTFSLLNQYDGGRCPLYHLDLYRLNSPDEILSAGLEEYLIDPRGVTAVEWFDRWQPIHLKPEPATSAPLRSRAEGVLRIVLLETLSEQDRRIAYEDTGP